MKKRLLLLCTILALTLSGCGAPSEPASENTPAESVPAATEAPTPSPTPMPGTAMFKMGNPASILLADIAEESGDAANAWIKVATAFDPELTVYDVTSMPANTIGIAVTFEVEDFDLGEATLYWCYQLKTADGTVSVWDTSSPTDTLTITEDGKYCLVFDANAALGAPIAQIESFQMVFPCTTTTATEVELKSAVCCTTPEELTAYTTGKVE
ncbi:MAG: hypothetical protein IJZ82_01865 [Lachnospiraceae bacterium]|nr:hypothetical protein [Lachnospiraceae bacterium]